MTWKDLVVSGRAHSSLCQHWALFPLPLSESQEGRGQTHHQLWCRCSSLPEPLCSHCGLGGSDLCPLQRGAFQSHRKHCPGRGGGAHLVLTVHTSCHVSDSSGAWSWTDLSLLFCLLSSLSLSPRLGNSGRNASSWSHGVKEGGDGGTEEGYGRHLAT